jgi:uncharacterized membrane protein YphA (DoxX/SURF4 family)
MQEPGNMIEKFWYEVSPYIYVVLGLLVIVGRFSLVATVFGALLLTAAAIILRLRWAYRN